MLAIFPTFNRRALLGYSLIEVIVVLALLTLVTSIVIPNLSSTLDRYRLQSRQDEVLIQLSGLGYLAYQKQQSFVLRPDGDVGDLIDLPEGWALELEGPIRFQANGICSGGEIRLVYKQEAERFLLIAPFCRLERISDA